MEQSSDVMIGAAAHGPEAAEGDEHPVIMGRFIHIADLHFWRVTRNPFRLLNKRFLGNLNVYFKRRHQFDTAVGASGAAAAAATGVKTALLTGDFTSTALREEFEQARAFVDELRRQFETVILPGNHDYYTFESFRRRRFETYFGPYLPSGGYPTRVDTAAGAPMILAPTACPNVVSSRGRITAAEVTAVEALLKETQGPAVVAGHYPVLHETPGYSLTKGRRLRGAEALRQVMGAHCARGGGPLLYVCGHAHRFDFAADRAHPGLWHLCTGAFFHRNLRDGVTGEFAEVAIKRDRFEVFRHTLREDGWLREGVTAGAAG